MGDFVEEAIKEVDRKMAVKEEPGAPMYRKAICDDIIKKLGETNQVYIVEHDIPISVSKTIFNMLNEARKRKAEQKGVPEVQYEFEDLFFDMLGAK